MSIIFVLIPLGLVLVGFAAWAFFWAVNDGQFDDLDTPSISILTEDERGNGDLQRFPPAAPGSVVESDTGK